MAIDGQIDARRCCSQRTLEKLEPRLTLDAVPIVLDAWAFEHVSQFESRGELRAREIGDFDLDGFDDLAISAGAQLRTYLGDGTGHFREGPLLEGLPTLFPKNPTDLSSADIDGDGDLDLLLAHRLNLWVISNRGTSDGVWDGFDITTSDRLSSPAQSLVVEDFNQDTVPDVAISTEERLLVRFGKEDASFGDATEYTAGGERIVAGDVDDDGDFDIVISNQERGTVEVLINDSEGFFEGGAPLSGLRLHPTDVELGDIDADGDLDLVVAHNYSDDINVSIMEGDGTGTFSFAEEYEIVGWARRVELGDLDGDGDLDLAIGYGGHLHHPRYDNGPGGTAVLLGNGALEEFSDPIRVACCDESDPLAVPLDANPGVELIVIQPEREGFRAVVLADAELPVFEPTLAGYLSTEVSSQYSQYVLADLDVDGSTDVLGLVSAQGAPVRLVVGRQDEADFDVIEFTFGNGRLIVSDFDGDQLPDAIAIGEPGRNGITFLPGDGGGDFGSPTTTRQPHERLTFQAVDANGDGWNDLVGVGRSSRTITARTFFGLGDGTFTPTDDIQRVGLANDYRLAYVNNDAFPDLITVDSLGIITYVGTSVGAFEPLNRVSERLNDFTIRLAEDLDMDGNVDLVLSRWNTPETRVYRGDGRGEFTQTSMIRAAAESLYTEDISGDGLPELVAIVNANYPQRELLVWQNVGDGRFEVNDDSMFQLYSRVSGLRHNDMDMDGYFDLVLSVAMDGPGGGLVVLTGRPDGTHNPPVVQMFSRSGFFGMPYDNDQTLDEVFAVEDVDDDGDLDIIASGSRGFGIVKNHAAQRWPPGDSSRDGLIDAGDVVTLCSLVHEGRPNPAAFDLSGDAQLTLDDVEVLFEQTAVGSYGDANLDGRFDSSDFVTVFQPGAYESEQAADWTGGDWNCDGRFTSRDIVQAFLGGNYYRPAIAAIGIRLPRPTINDINARLGGLFDKRISTNRNDGDVGSETTTFNDARPPAIRQEMIPAAPLANDSPPDRFWVDPRKTLSRHRSHANDHILDDLSDVEIDGLSGRHN